jgi:hypothetical protein
LGLYFVEKVSFLCVAEKFMKNWCKIANVAAEKAEKVLAPG